MLHSDQALRFTPGLPPCPGRNTAGLPGNYKSAVLHRRVCALGGMSTFSLKNLTRDSFIVEFEGKEYNVSGERYGDGTWEIFARMVYRLGPGGDWKLLEDESLKAKVVAALREHWHEYQLPWTLLPGKD